MSKSKSPRVFSREFKLGIVCRLLAGENVSALGRELKLSRKDLYAWRDRFLAGGPQALRGRGRPPRAASGTAAPVTVEAPPDPRRRPLTRLMEPMNSLPRRAGALPSSSARSASSRSNLIFFGKPCGRSTHHASRTAGLA